MAANEHKNLSDVNRHNPKGLEVAINDTILSKSIGTGSGLTDGNLQWVLKNQLKTDNVRFGGASSFGTTNYYIANDHTNNKDSQFASSYGSATATTATIQNAIRAGRFIAYADSNLVRWTGGITSATGDTTYLTLWRVTPVDDDATELTITELKEVSITGSGNGKIRTFDIDMTLEGDNTLTKGDIIIPAVKNSDSGGTMYFNSTLQLSYNN